MVRSQHLERDGGDEQFVGARRDDRYIGVVGDHRATVDGNRETRSVIDEGRQLVHGRRQPGVVSRRGHLVGHATVAHQFRREFWCAAHRWRCRLVRSVGCDRKGSLVFVGLAVAPHQECGERDDGDEQDCDERDERVARYRTGPVTTSTRWSFIVGRARRESVRPDRCRACPRAGSRSGDTRSGH